MTWGGLLILIGVELNLVDSVVLTPRATQFWNNKLSSSPFEDDGIEFADSPFALASQRPGTSGSSFSDQYATRNSFPYSTPNFRRNRSDSRGVLGGRSIRSAGYGNTGNAENLANSIGRQTQLADQKMITPPSWYCWPPIFLGAVLFLFGAVRTE